MRLAMLVVAVASVDKILKGAMKSGSSNSNISFNDMINRVVEAEVEGGRLGAFGNLMKYGKETGEVKLGNSEVAQQETKSEDDLERERKEKEVRVCEK